MELLRAYELIFIRQGLPDKASCGALGEKFEACFPGQSGLITRELVNLLVALGSPNVAHRVVPLLNRATASAQPEFTALLKRNPAYGQNLSASQLDQPDTQQIGYAFALGNLKSSWDFEDRKQYFAWFAKARTWSGGYSYQKFLTQIEDDAIGNASDSDRTAIQAGGLRVPYQRRNCRRRLDPGRIIRSTTLSVWRRDG